MSAQFCILIHYCDLHSIFICIFIYMQEHYANVICIKCLYTPKYRLWWILLWNSNKWWSCNNGTSCRSLLSHSKVCYHLYLKVSLASSCDRTGKCRIVELISTSIFLHRLLVLVQRSDLMRGTTTISISTTVRSETAGDDPLSAVFPLRHSWQQKTRSEWIQKIFSMRHTHCPSHFECPSCP